MSPISPRPLAALLAMGLAAAALAGGAPSHASPPPVEPDLWVMSSDGTGQRVLAENAHHGGTWSPDGTRIAYGGRTGIYVVSADGDSPALLIAPGFSPAWSPDGTQIAYVLVDGAGAHLRVMAPDGSNQRTLTDITGYLVGLAWSPDGSALAFIRGEGSARPQVEVIGADGSGRRVLATVGSGRPSWSPDGSALTVVGPGGDVVAVDAATGAQRVVAATG
ncbi:MAG: hypothetical protein M3273_04955, partial [Actinomycetota bacterium]|nr:hypothetical protein [Actinomycetota bacterium]